MKSIQLLLALALIVLVSSTTVNLMTVKPAQPKNVVVGTMYRSDVKEFVHKYHKDGYKVHTVTSPNESGNLVVIMERY